MADDVHRLRKRAMQRRKAKLLRIQERTWSQEQYQNLDRDDDVHDRAPREGQTHDNWIVLERGAP